MTDDERIYELDRLTKIIKIIKYQLASCKLVSDNAKDTLKSSLSHYWDDRSRSDEAQLIATLDRNKGLAAIYTREYRQLQQMKNNPYFGRIDFSEEHNSSAACPEKIYIGIAGLTDKESYELLIYDWRTPLAGMFYDFSRGPAFYSCPEGTIHGYISLKRQYKVIGGTMKYMFDSDLIIEDEVLQEVLSKTADEKMHTIVSSIQREQNQVIRNKDDQFVFVEGPAGSGKTSIALHRIAFLLYQHRETINSGNILILSPNSIFSDYISHVLPEIGEENVPHTTFHSLISDFAANYSLSTETRNEHLEALFTVNYNDSSNKSIDRITNIRFKTSNDFNHMLEQYLRYIDHNLLLTYPPILFRDQIVFSQADWQLYNDRLSYLPLIRRLTKIKELISSRLRPLIHQMRKQKTKEITDKAEEVNEKTIRALARIAAKKEFASVIAEIQQLTVIDPLDYYRRLFDLDDLFYRFYDGTLGKSQCQLIRDYTLAYLQYGRIPYEDSSAVLYFYWKLHGFPFQPAIKYLVIDEAQDYTALQFKILATLFPNCSWTVLGDPAQSLHPYIQTINFPEAARLMGLDKPALFRLTKSYRSTSEIQLFCQSLLPNDYYQVDHIQRSGPKPQVIKAANWKSFVIQTVSLLQDIQIQPWQTIAVICKTAQQCSVIHQEIVGSVDVKLITHDDNTFPQGIIIIPSYLAKGLEFDIVLVLHTDTENYRQEADRNILYTVCTRAMHRLYLLHYKELSNIILSIDPQLYHSSATKNINYAEH